jgi:hypothetical protein
VTDLTHPELKLTVQRKHQWESSWSAVTPILGGSVERRFNAARSLSLTVPNPYGRASFDWKVGDRVRVFIGWNATEPQPIFEGVVPPGRGIQVGAGSPPTVAIHAVDAVGLLELETITISPNAIPGTDAVSYEGWDAAMAIRDLIGTSQAAALVGDLGAVRGASPARVVGREIAEPTGTMTRKAYIDKIVAGMTDADTAPDRPKFYHYWHTAKADGTPALYLQPERDPAVDPSIRTITYTTDLIGVAVQTRSDQATACLASSSTDATVFLRYQDDDAADRYGRVERKLPLPTTNTDELRAAARAVVQANRYPVRSLEVAVRDGWRHELNQIVTITTPYYGGTGTFLITGVDVAFSPGDAYARLRLAAAEELLSEALARALGV